MPTFSKIGSSPVEEKFLPSAADSSVPDITVKPVQLDVGRQLPSIPVPPQNNISDYLSKRALANNSHEEEENPFDSQFGGGPVKSTLPAKTPGGTLLPSIQALQSASSPGFGMSGLRSGPLSPNMLTGPKESAEDYFSADHNLIGDGPRGYTPVTSDLRGMHSRVLPTPSPGGYSFGAGAVQTPGLAEFQRTAIQAASLAAQHQRDMNVTSQPQQHIEDNHNVMGNYPDNDSLNAAASLQLLTQTSASSRDSSPHHNLALGQSRPPPFSAQQHMLNRNHQMLNQNMQPVQANGQVPGRPNNHPLANGHAGTRNNSIHSNSMSPTSNGHGMPYDNEMNGQGAQGKKRAGTKRKASTTKTPPKSNKRAKSQKGSDDSKPEEFTHEDLDNMDDQLDFEEEENNNTNNNGKPKKPETEDEKRKSFLERNRVAALKCRQRKKQWLNNLQSKVDTYTNENESLHQKIQHMAHEIMQLKTMLFAHKDTPLGIQQGIAQYVVTPLYDDMPPMHQSQNPYGLGTMPPSQNPNM
ncbi:hypothetical protein EAF00_004583 [Botryotinia globosa]|nr:hypothetical protein EAF00_004583 [Botryotinia globosa]